jgi:hypothetical protein
MSRANNYFAKSYSGIFGQQVTLEDRGGKVIMTFPHARKKSKPSERQVDYRRKFQWASDCATNILKDPEVLKAYRGKAGKGQTAYNLALRDYLNGRIEGLTCLHDLPCFDTGAGHDLQKIDLHAQPEKRKILFPVQVIIACKNVRLRIPDIAASAGLACSPVYSSVNRTVAGLG